MPKSSSFLKTSPTLVVLYTPTSLLADAWKIAEPLDGPTMTKYKDLAKEHDVWLSLGGFQEKGEEEKKMCSNSDIIIARYTCGG